MSSEELTEIDIIDLMLKHDADNNNKEGRGFMSASRLFDEIGAPNNMRSYVLEVVIKLELFEYNTPKTGIRATYLGMRIYKDGGYKKHKRNEKIADWVGYLERIINTIKP